MKKVLHIINSLDLGGSETALYRLLCTQTQVPNSDWQVMVVVLRGPGFYSEKLQQIGIKVHHLQLSKKTLFFSIVRLYKLLYQYKPNVVQTWLYHSDVLGGVLARLAGVKKIIWGIRCEGVGLSFMTRCVKTAAALLSYVIPTHIIVNSYQAQLNHQRCGYQKQKFKLIHNGVAPVDFPRALECVNWEESIFAEKVAEPRFLSLKHSLKIGTLARYHPDKDLDNFLNMMEYILPKFPTAYFILCGPGIHKDNARLMQTIQCLPHANQLILIDGVADIKKYLPYLDLFVLSSKTESFPNALVEAMACALPCVSTVVGETPDILKDAGLLVAKQNAKALGEACVRLLSEPLEVRKAVGLKARQRVETHFSIENTVLKTLALYE